jgi:hypothetical protein
MLNNKKLLNYLYPKRFDKEFFFMFRAVAVFSIIIFGVQCLPDGPASTPTEQVESN